MLIFFGVFILYFKHDVGNDSSLSDWLINYSGGFVRRGLTGDIILNFAYLFSIKLRDSILIFQICIFITYYLLVYHFLKNIISNRLLLLAIFSPVFILYPVAELEAFGRKELIIFLIIILYFFLDINKIKNQIIFKVFVFPISILIWEPVIIFYPYIFVVDLIVFRISKINKDLIILLMSYSIIFLLTLLVYTNPFPEENFKVMVDVLKKDFGESCYMSCHYVGNQAANSFVELLDHHVKMIEPPHLIRYFLIILIGFFPLFFLLKISKTTRHNSNLLYLFLLAFAPSLLVYLLMYDWARIVHVSYTFMLLSYAFLLKNKFIKIDQNKLNNNQITKFSNKIFLVLFVIFCLGWNPKVVMRDDVASKPVYAVPYKFYKYFLKKK